MDKKAVAILGGAALLAYLWLRGQAGSNTEPAGGQGSGFYDTSGGLGGYLAMLPSSGTSLDAAAPLTTIKVEAPTFPAIPTEADETAPTSKKAFTAAATSPTGSGTTAYGTYYDVKGQGYSGKLPTTQAEQAKLGYPAGYGVSFDALGQGYSGKYATNIFQQMANSAKASTTPITTKKEQTVAAIPPANMSGTALDAYLRVNNLAPTGQQLADLKKRLGG